MMDEFICTQDLREQELLKQGYVKPEKAFFRVGRVIFKINVVGNEFTDEDAESTPLGLVMRLNDPTAVLDESQKSLLQNIFGSPGSLRVVVEGDDDCGFASKDPVILTGYRGGLDDVFVEGKLLQTVHGSEADVMRNFTDYLALQKSWMNVPDWESYDGVGYHIQHDKELEGELENIIDSLRVFIEKYEHRDDMPEWVKKKFLRKTETNV